MEENNTEVKEKSDVAELTSKTKVLSIGDDESPAREKNRNTDILQENLRKHFCQLLTGSRIAIDVVPDWDKVDRFGAASIKEGNQPRRYHFYVLHGNNYKPGEIISGPVFDGNAMMEVVRNRLKEENWISKNVIETPLKAKLGSEPYAYDQYIQQIVSEALYGESPRIFRFVQYLHRNYK
ncbi:PREDICTED: uncharacterized protein LOC108617241 [Drosophila arizonae]|uniref:Uncharacterized protein LOC108617241 n=1 Tax=Drosophila arizonae TaxID=7263 RepID=A0ABM1PML6_DROAR|nr:PREDICTED: uncharacterized protein LOC108617241 [Drosophila arizonae]